MSRIDVKKMLFDKDYIVNNPKMSLHAVTWDGKKIKKIHKAGRTELSNDVGNKVNLLIQNIAGFGAVSFGKKDGKDLTFECARDLGRTSKIYTNFALLFRDASFTHLKPEIANVLSDKQKADIYTTFSSVHFMLSKIYDLSAVVNPTDGNYATIERYMKEITETSKLCRDIYESALSSEKFIERRKQESLRGADDFSEVKTALTNDIVMAFEKMGWDVSGAISVSKEDITIEKVEDAIKQEHANVTVGGESPFEKDQVATFIYNYINLSEDQKRGFSIPRLFEVYGDTAKNLIETKYSYDEVVKQEHLDALNVDMQRNFGESGWKLTQLSSDGSLMRYSKEMMDIVHSADIAREERKSLGNANIDSVRLAGVPGLEIVRGELQDENELEGLRQEIKQPFLDAIARMPTRENDFKINIDNPIVQNYMALLATEKHGTMGGYVSDFTKGYYFIELCQEVYDCLDSEITSVISKAQFLENNGFARSTPTPTPPTGAPTAEKSITVSPLVTKDALYSLLENEDVRQLINQWMDDVDFENNTELQDKYFRVAYHGMDSDAQRAFSAELEEKKYGLLYPAIAGLVNDAALKTGSAGKSIEAVWESAKEDIGKACEIETKNALFNSTAEATNFSHLYRFGMFETLVPVFTDQLSHLSFEGDDDAKKDQKRNALNSLINQVIGASPNPQETEFYNAVADCVMNGTTTGNAYYDTLYKEAREDILISRYSAYIKKLQDGLAVGEVDGKPLTDDQKSEIQNKINAFGEAKDRSKLVEMAEKATQEPAGNPAIKDVKNRQEILTEYDISLKTKDPLKISSLGDKLEFDAQGLAKKLKPFNVKAGQKYLDGLIKAIKNVKIIEQTATDAKGKDTPEKEGTPESPVAGDNENGGTGSGNGGNGTTNPNYTPEELKEKAAFYIMGHALDQSLNDMIRAGGLTEEDKNRLLSEQQDMKNLFNLLAFGEDKDKKFTFNNGKNAIQCGKIGYIQQIIYSKATDPNFKMNADELALVLADGQDVAIGARQERETDDMYIARIKANPTIASIIRSLDSISSEVAYALVGITSTKDGKDGHFAGKINEKIMEALKDAKTPDEIKKVLDSLNTTSFDNSTHKTIEGPIAKIIRDSQLDFAVAKSREELRERIKDYAMKNIIDFSADKQTQKRQVQQFLNSEEVNKVPGMIYDTTIESNATARKEILDRVANELYTEIDNGLTASSNPANSANPANPANPANSVNSAFATTPAAPKFAFKLDGDLRQILKANVEMFMANEQLEYTEIGKELIINVINSESTELAEKLAKISLEDFVKLIKELEAEIIKEKPEVKLDEPLEETFEEEIKFKPLTIDDIKFDKFLFYGTDVNNNDYMQVILHAINYVCEHNGDYENFKQQILGNAKLAKDDLKAIIDDPDFQSDIEKYLPVKSAEKPKDNSAYQQIVEELAKAGFKLDPEGNYTTQVAEKLLELAKSNPLFNRQFTNDEIQGIVEAYSEYQRKPVDRVKVVIDALNENGFEVDSDKGTAQGQIGKELEDAKYDKIRDVIKSLTEEEAKAITSKWIELSAKQGNADMSR